MDNKTQLEVACENALGENYSEYYEVLSELLVLNPNLLKENDTRFSAQLTFILFNDETKDKPQLVNELLESNENRLKTKTEVIEHTKKLLDMDPEFIVTDKIIAELKKIDDPNYTELMRKVNTKYEMKMYFSGETTFRRRI